MSRFSKMTFVEDAQQEANRQTASLAGLAFALFLVVVGLFLIHQLTAKAVTEDCLLAGRLNCDAALNRAPVPAH